MRTTAAIPVSRRVGGFVYAIRNIVAEARKVEAAGTKVRYLNIGDPITFGFKTPPHMIEAVEPAMRDGHNGHAPPGRILPPRDADGPGAPMASLYPDAPIVSFSSLSKAYLAPGWRAGWMAVGRTDRLDDFLGAVKKLADGRLCSTGPMEHAIPAALDGDRSHEASFRTALRERADLTVRRLNAIDGIQTVAPTAAFYAMPQVSLPPGVTDEHYVLALLRATGVLCVYGSGFGTKPEDGFFRVVFLASPGELSDIFDLVGAFTRDFLSRGSLS